MHSQGVALDAGELARLIYAFDYNEDGFISRQVRLRLRGKGDRRNQRNERLDAHKQTNKRTNKRANKHCARSGPPSRALRTARHRQRRPDAAAGGRRRFAVLFCLGVYANAAWCKQAWHGMAWRSASVGTPPVVRRAVRLFCFAAGAAGRRGAAGRCTTVYIHAYTCV
jgi:hypothetical protein